MSVGGLHHGLRYIISHVLRRPRPIPTNLASTEADKLALHRGGCLVASPLELAAMAVLQCVQITV